MQPAPEPEALKIVRCLRYISAKDTALYFPAATCARAFIGFCQNPLILNSEVTDMLLCMRSIACVRSGATESTVIG